MKKVIGVIIVIILVIVLFILSKNSLINNTNNILSTNINSFYEYINKYIFDSSGTVDIVANYKGAHGSTNPINFSYNFNNEYKNNKLYTSLENTDGYYENEFSNKLLNIFMNIRGNEELKNIFTVKETKEEFNKIEIIFDQNIINNILNSNYEEFKLIINTNILYLGIKDYNLVLDDYNLNISKDFKEISNDDFKLNISNVGYNLKYKDKLKINYKNKENIDYYNISIDDCIISMEISNNIKIEINKTVNIYNGLNINIEFKKLALNKTNTISRETIPLYRYFDNANISLGGLQ